METIILPLDINISDAIMSFQESGFQITQKVFDACGKPDYLRSKREAEAAAVAGADRSGSGRAISLDDGNRQRLQGVGHPETRKEVEVATPQPIQSKGKSDFERMMEDLRRVVRIHFGLDFVHTAKFFSPFRFAIPRVFGGTCRTECVLTLTRGRRPRRPTVTAFD